MDQLWYYVREMFDVSQWSITGVDIGVMIGYFVLMMIVGLMCKSISHNISDYVRMGCKSTWWLMGTSIFMLMMSAGTFTGNSAQAYLSGWSFILIGLGGFVSYMLMAAFFAPWMRRTRAITPADTVRQRYGVLQEQINAYIGAIGGMLWGGVWLYSFGMFMAVVFNVPVPTVIIFAGIVVVFYSVAGGSWSVQITDTLQAYILVPIVFVVFILSMKEVGWMSGLMQGIADKGLEDDYKVFMEVGHQYKSSAAKVGVGYFGVGWLVASFIHSFAISANMTSCWRFLSCKNDSEARKAALLAGCLLFFGSALYYMPAMVGRILYEDEIMDLKNPPSQRGKYLQVAEQDTPDLDMAGEPSEMPATPVAPDAPVVEDDSQASTASAPPPRKYQSDEGLPNPADGAYAVVAKNVLPPGMLGLVVIALFAATMSSLDSSLTGNAGIVCNNIYPALARLFRKQPWTGMKLLRLTQVVNLLLGIWAMVLAFLLWKGAGDSSVFDISLNIVLLVSSPVVLSMVLSFFVPWLPFWAPLVGMFFGFFGSVSYMASGTVAGWVAGWLGADSAVAGGFQAYADFINSLLWHHKVYMSLGLTVIPTFATSIFWYTATPAYRERVDAFFKQIRTPIDFEKEVGDSADHSLMKMVGVLGMIMAGTICLIFPFAEDVWGVFAVGFVVAFIGGISLMMYLLGRRAEKRLPVKGDPPNASETSDADAQE